MTEPPLPDYLVKRVFDFYKVLCFRFFIEIQITAKLKRARNKADANATESPVFAFFEGFVVPEFLDAPAGF